MNSTEPPPGICAAPDELLALARAVRPAWDHDVLAGAILAARNAGWTWDRTLAETVRLMRDPDGSPWDLKRAAADPFRHAGVPPGTEKRGAALARRLLGYGAQVLGAAVVLAGVAWLGLAGAGARGPAGDGPGVGV